MYWGLSEALDLIEEYLTSQRKDESAEPPTELNILLYGPNDPRHIIKTMARMQSIPYKTPIKVNVYILEGCLELLARHMLLLNIALEPDDELSLKAKTHMFMDLYGNSLMRPASHNYMCSKGRVYIDLITDLDGKAKEKLPMFDFSALKYGERDGLTGIFTFWQNKPNNLFDIPKYWEQRVRSHLETRYDSRFGAFDWDLSMRLRDNGVERVCAQEYKHWRDVGVAFVFPEFEQTLPNKTLAAAVCGHGDGFRHRGYLGDITTGPFVTFGEKCAEAAMCKSNHGTNTYRSTDITERNVFQLMFEIQERQPYVHDLESSRQFGATTLLLTKHMGAAPSVLDDRDELHRYDAPAMPVENITITFLALEEVLNISSRDKFKGFFDIAFVSHNYFAFLKDNFRDVLRENGIVLFETKQNQTLRKEGITEFLDKIKALAGQMSLDPITHFNINLPLPIVRYRLGSE